MPVLRNLITICNLKQNTDFGSEQNVRATLLFVDPMSDIAMLGEPGAQELLDECHRYSTFTEAIEPMSIGAQQGLHSREIVIPISKKEPVRMTAPAPEHMPDASQGARVERRVAQNATPITAVIIREGG
jgi:hypothetical protein